MSLIKTSAMAQETPKVDRPQIILKRFDDAPFSGVLVPPDIYKKIHADLLMRDEFETRLRNCLKEKTQLVNAQPPDDQRWSFLFLGFVTGYVISLAMTK